MTLQSLSSANSTITTTDQTTGEPIQNGTSSQTTIKPLNLSERTMRPRDPYTNSPALKVGSEGVTENQD